MLENERSFLVKDLTIVMPVKREPISQHYLTQGKEPLRLRRRGDKFELTQKKRVTQDDLSRQEETTLMVDERMYNALAPLAVRSLTKTRSYLFLDNGLVAEIDVFQGPLEGLLMVEVEFPNEAAREAFVPPDWFGRDVSQEEWSSNAFLAGKTFEEIEHFVKG